MNYLTRPRWKTYVQTLLSRAAALVVLPVLMIMSMPTSIVAASASSERQRFFDEAAQEFKAPKELLLSISYNETRWEDHDGQPSVKGGYGLMHLTTQTELVDGRGDPNRPIKPRQQLAANQEYTLDKASQLLGIPADKLKTDERQNVRGGAAVLAAYAKESNNGKLPGSLNEWYTAVARSSNSADAEAAKAFADDVFATIKQGVTRTTFDGQTISLPATNVQPEVSQLKLPELPMLPKPDFGKRKPECPRDLNCKFEPARFAQNNPADPKDYGNYDIANRPRDMKIKYIVIHDTEGSYESAISWFQDPRSYVAAHYVIRSSDGEVTQMIPTKDVGWQAGNWYVNMHSIGVEHEGYAATGGAWYTETMYRASAKLVRYLADKYDIPIDREHIVGHEQYHGLTPARAKAMHNDPGPYWDWEHYMDLLGYRSPSWEAPEPGILIAPQFSQNKPPVTACNDGTCTELPSQPANFIYLRTEPRQDAPYLTDAGLHPDGAPGTTEINDWSAKAFYGQRFAAAGREGDWTAIWFGGQKGWFYNPDTLEGRTGAPICAALVTPKAGLGDIPIYGRPVPEASAYKNGVPPLTLVPLQYTIPAGQTYVAYDNKAKNDYYHVLSFDRSTPGDGTLVIGKEKYIPISYNHRQAYVKASDVNLVEQ